MPAPRPRRTQIFLQRVRSPLFRSELVQAAAGAGLGFLGGAVALARGSLTEPAAPLAPIASNLARLAFVALLLALVGVVSMAPWLLVGRAKLGHWLGRFGPLLLAPSLVIPWIHGDSAALWPRMLVFGLAAAPLGLTLVMATALSLDPVASRELRVVSWILVILGVVVAGLHAGRLPAAAASPLSVRATDAAAVVVLVAWMLLLCRTSKQRVTAIILRRVTEQRARQELP